MTTGEVIALIKAFGGGGGGSSGGGVLAVNDDNGTLDKTWQEIADAVATTGAAIVYEFGGHVSGAATVIECAPNLLDGKFYVYFGKESAYKASSADGYPAYSE